MRCTQPRCCGADRQPGSLHPPLLGVARRSRRFRRPGRQLHPANPDARESWRAPRSWPRSRPGRSPGSARRAPAHDRAVANSSASTPERDRRVAGSSVRVPVARWRSAATAPLPAGLQHGRALAARVLGACVDIDAGGGGAGRRALGGAVRSVGPGFPWGSRHAWPLRPPSAPPRQQPSRYTPRFDRVSGPGPAGRWRHCWSGWFPLDGRSGARADISTPEQRSAGAGFTVATQNLWYLHPDPARAARASSWRSTPMCWCWSSTHPPTRLRSRTRYRPVPVPLDRRETLEQHRNIQQLPLEDVRPLATSAPAVEGELALPGGRVRLLAWHPRAPREPWGLPRVGASKLPRLAIASRGARGSGGGRGLQRHGWGTSRCVVSPEPPGCATPRPCREAACRRRGRPWPRSRR